MCELNRSHVKSVSFLDIQDLLNKANFDQMPRLHVAILRNVMLEPIEPYIRYLSYRMGYSGQVHFGEYDNVFQEALGANRDLLNRTTDCVLIFLRLESISWDLARNFEGLTPEKVLSERERIQDYARAVIVGIRRQTDAMILWHGFELPANPAFGILDSQNRTGQVGMIRELNDFLRTSLRKTANSFFVDLNLCLARIGDRDFYDPRYWHIGRAPFTREALCEIACEDFKFIRALKGKNKKCLILDCDNVLWGGIIGEDGLAGIQLGRTYPGSAYYEFQQEVLNLYNRGIIIALCSKNNPDDVWEVFQKHPDMVLKEEHIAKAQINWQDKTTNIRQIALDLNIGLDSLVFIDDSEFEIHLVRAMLPEVEAIHFPKNRAVAYRDMLASCGLFDTLTLSEEDKQRGAMYKGEAARRELQLQATDITTYCRSLEMVIEVRFVDDFAIPRIAQLTQKTNQFNLTTRRYSDADIKAFVDSDKWDVVYARLSDRFGDSGIIGVCVLKYIDETATIDTFLLSCRVLGRGVEDVFLAQALKLARKRGSKVAIGEYYATRKNSQVKGFYARQGFSKLDGKSSAADAAFQYELEDEVKPKGEFFERIISEIDDQERS